MSCTYMVGSFYDVLICNRSRHLLSVGEIRIPTLAALSMGMVNPAGETEGAERRALSLQHIRAVESILLGSSVRMLTRVYPMSRSDPMLSKRC